MSYVEDAISGLQPLVFLGATEIQGLRGLPRRPWLLYLGPLAL